MDVNIYQLAQMAIYAAIVIAFWKLKTAKLRAFMVCIWLVVFLANPLRSQIEGVASLERVALKNHKIPARVVVESKSFKVRQKEELNSLTNQSEGISNEINH